MRWLKSRKSAGTLSLLISLILIFCAGTPVPVFAGIEDTQYTVIWHADSPTRGFIDHYDDNGDPVYSDSITKTYQDISSVREKTDEKTPAEYRKYFDGKQLIGWAKTSGGESVTNEDGAIPVSKLTPNGTTELFAVYADSKATFITLDAGVNGYFFWKEKPDRKDKTKKMISVASEEEFNPYLYSDDLKVTDPDRYEFEGWYHDEVLTQRVPPEGFVISDDETLYAGYKEKEKEEQKQEEQKQEEKTPDEKSSDIPPKTEEPASTPAPAPELTDGETVVSGGIGYTVLSASANTVSFTKAKNTKSVSVPATVSINGKQYAVTTVGANAFKGDKIRTVTIGANVSKLSPKAMNGSKATTLVVKSRKLTKNSVKGSLKGSKVKTIKVKVGNKAQNKTFIGKYKKIFTKKNAGRKVTVK